MKVALAAVVSTNGLLTNGRSDMSWISEEDKKLFSTQRANADAVIMGGNVYRTIRKKLKLTVPKLRIVVTRDPKKYQGDRVKGQLEFTNDSPKKIIARLKSAGYKNVLLVGGSVSNAFIKDGLVDEFHLTIEPLYFGRGHNLTGQLDFLANLKLVHTKRLNERGTLYLIYEFIR